MYQYHRVDPPEGRYGVNIGKNVWHTIEMLESSVIFECKEVPFVEHVEEGVIGVKSEE